MATAIGTSLGCAASGREEAVTVTVTTPAVTVTVREPARRRTARPSGRLGRQVFARVCMQCHTLRRRDWRNGKISLVDLQPSYETTIEKVTTGGVAMPSFRGRLSERQIRSVAAFVARTAARRGRAR